MKKRSFLSQALAATALVGLCLNTAHAAAAHPDKPIRIVVPFAAGGVTDAMVRLLQEPVSQSLGQTVIVENKTGAAGAIAARTVADSPPDGHTLLVVNTGLLAITPFVQQDAGFHPTRSFTPVAGFTSAPSVLLAHPSVPAGNVREFIDYARAHPGSLEYAVVGKGAYGDLSTANFARQAGIEMVSVPYQGNAQTTLALLAGEVKVQLTILSGALKQYIDDGRIKALGVATARPTALVPGAPPIADTLPGFEAVVYTGLVAPAKTPAAIVQKIGDAFVQALRTPDVQAKLLAMGMESVPLGPAAYGVRIQEEIAQFAPAIEQLQAR